MSARRISVKRGDTLRLDCQLLDSDGVTAIDLTGWTVRSQIREADGTLIDDLTVMMGTLIEGRYSLIAEATDWPVSDIPARMDVEYTDDVGVVQSTETIMVQIVADETR